MCTSIKKKKKKNQAVLLNFQNENYSNTSNIKRFYINQPTDMFNGRGTIKTTQQSKR